jgi:hypothetical protein
MFGGFYARQHGMVKADERHGQGGRAAWSRHETVPARGVDEMHPAAIVASMPVTG